VGQRSYARILLKASTDDTARANIEINDDFDLALDDFERALQAASDVEPDLIAAARLRAEERAQDRVPYRTAASFWVPGHADTTPVAPMAELRAAGTWLNAQPASARLDTLRHRYIYVLAKTDAQQALLMTREVITVPEARDEAILTILHQWALQDVYAARQWVENEAPTSSRLVRSPRSRLESSA
jgi:hypothetical protein